MDSSFAISADQALELLQNEDIVALPTETVYGLAGLATSLVALGKIFATKQRPFFDPLILHVKDITQAKEFAEFDDVSLKLAEKFWPGPLTLVLKKTEKVLDLVNNGGDTVALRVPQHPIFQKILQQSSAPLAAPSANMFGKTSPTTAEHVQNEFNEQVPVVDGGPCNNGIESTVVQVNNETNCIEILRPGVVTQEDLGEFGLDVVFRKKENSPGHLPFHYQPTVTFYLAESACADADLKDLKAEKWTLPDSPTLAARQLYSDLREFSQRQQPFYLALTQDMENSSQWAGVLDRLEKACHGFVRESFTGHEVFVKE